MKVLSAIALMLLLNTLHAQQIFHGSIVYKYHLPNISDAPEILVNYGINKIKIIYKEKDNWDKAYFLIDLDSGKFYRVLPETKAYTSWHMHDINTKQISRTKMIGGHQTYSVELAHSSASHVFGPWSSGNSVLFVAPGLFYPVPEKYKDNPELIMIQNNHIVLGAEKSINGSEMEAEIPDSLLKQTLISIEAIRIDEQPLDNAEFLIPPEFKKLTWLDVKDSDTVLVDTVYSVEEIEEIPPPPPPPAKKKSGSSSNPPKKTKPIKTQGIKPKNPY